jgi:methylated-DNA-[protein]-cysteine S-methyltransferase
MSTSNSKKSPSKFREKVLAVVKKIPKGSVMTYQDVARAAGCPGAARAVGTIMSKNWDETIPCHRVIRSDGLTGQYNRGAAMKIKKLRSEGVSV